MKKKRTAQSGLFNRRALLIGAATCSIVFPIISGLAFFHSEAPTKVPHAALTFAQRVTYQREIEEVYWRHRIWPRNGGENSKPKPSLDEVMSVQQIETKVEDYLCDAEAVEDYWQRPITSEQLQEEMDRMAKHTKRPEVLRELFAALGDDPFVIAESLARPILAERLIGDIAKHAEHPSFRAKSRNPAALPTGNSTGSFDFAQDDKPANLDKDVYKLPEISIANGCTDDNWTTTSITNAPAARSSHTAVWTGSEMIVWGGYAGSYLNTGGRYDPSTDSWAAITTMNAPTPRGGNTAVWTGSEMIVWGGDNGFSLNTGGRYNPATDTWTPTNTSTAPLGRIFHTAVWDGSEMVVWGGWNEFELRSGGRYNPGTDSWTDTSITNAPSARFDHTAVWTGGEMIVWGGWNGSNSFNTGGRYNPGTDGWTATSTTNAPTSRYDHTAVLAGNDMIVWGGRNAGNYFNTGGKYNPSTDNWAATSTTNAPGARFSHTAVWTGSEMIVWGGTNMQKQFNTGGRYNPGTDNWMATMTNGPEQRAYHTAVWSGSEMIVWGGLTDIGPFYLNTGGRYCAAAASPTPTATPNPCHVTSSACGNVITGTAPTDFIINATDPVDPATIQPTDFTVNGISADASALINGNTTIVFHFNVTPVTQDLNTMHIPACAFNCGNGCVQDFTCTFTYVADTPTPTPTALATATPSPRPTPAARPRPTPYPRP